MTNGELESELVSVTSLYPDHIFGMTPAELLLEIIHFDKYMNNELIYNTKHDTCFSLWLLKQFH